ncbi:DUF4129 domain-containing protein [Natrialba swarupiae]|uniref:DUF4129 domain-containing protein n=1 Tax=Natrialba swarupiae TaxID=2448032 RepID=A0A5D5AQH9_9EURY|nr:DUF4129 domain-containing protein [Natrialba swarupiae]TYT63247.1 DUF4129 domain-containing protein [Natrialba swarupiae]
MSGRRRTLLVLGCIVCLLAVASALPAADPRLDAPGAPQGESAPGDWESVADPTDPVEEVTEPDSSDDAEDATDDSSEAAGSEPAPPGFEVSGAVEPGNEVRVETERSTTSSSAITVNGEEVASTGPFGRAEITVPYEEEMNVTIVDSGQSRTFDVPTDAAIEPGDGAAPGSDLEVAAAVGSTPVSDATVSLEGDPVATTDEAGKATVALPETAGPADVSVERGAVEGDRTIDVLEPDVEFAHPLLFPGSPAVVLVSADGDGIGGATVSVGDEETATGDDGRAWVWLPVTDEATVTAEVGAETATTTVGNLYLRLTAVVVLVPGLVIGAAVTYFRLVATTERSRWHGRTSLLVALADALAAFSDWIAGVRLPRYSLPSFEFGGGPSLGWPSLPSFSFPSYSRPSLGSVTRSSSSGSRRGIRSRVSDTLGFGDDEPDVADDDTGPTLADEPFGPRGPRAEIRATWHAVLDRVGIENRETRTPGQAAREVLSAGFPPSSVRRLVSIVRDVEYGGRDPSPERVADARATATELLAHEPDEEGDE